MNNKMTVVYVKKTGHAVAAVTRIVDPEGKLSATELVGAGLFVRNRTVITSTGPAGGENLIIPSNSLDVTVVDFDLEMFGAPLSFVVGGGVVGKLGNISGVTINKFTQKQIEVEIPGVPASGIGVWVQLEEVNPASGNAPERRVMEGTIEKGVSGTNKSVTLDITIQPSGPPASVPNSAREYYILVLVAGHQRLFAKKTPT